MQTFCPKCNASYNIDEKVLAKAHGQAQCCQCNHVFNAFENRVKDNTAPIQLTLNKPEEDSAIPDLRTPFNFDDDLDILDADEPLALDVDHQLGDTTKKSVLVPGLFVILLIILAIGQIAWIKRAELLKNPIATNYLKLACEKIGCELPEQRALNKFQVLERDLSPDSSRKNVLSLKLQFQNQATFAQLLPDLQLTFFNHNETVLARRRFRPDEYLFPTPKAGSTILADETLTINLLLEDPGPQTTSFKLKFL